MHICIVIDSSQIITKNSVKHTENKMITFLELVVK